MTSLISSRAISSSTVKALHRTLSPWGCAPDPSTSGSLALARPSCCSAPLVQVAVQVDHAALLGRQREVLEAGLVQALLRRLHDPDVLVHHEPEVGLARHLGGDGLHARGA